MKTRSTLPIFAISLLSAIMSGCTTRTGAKGDISIIKYNGPESYPAYFDNFTADTTLSFGNDSVSIPFTRIVKSYVSTDSNFYATFDIYGAAETQRINGTLASYVAELISRFDRNEHDLSSQLLSTDSIGDITCQALEQSVDSAISIFHTSVIPEAHQDSVPGTNLSVSLIPVYADESIITYAMTAECYYGGANGDEDFYLLSFERATGIPAGFHELVAPERQAQIRSLLVETIAASKGQSAEQYLADVNQWVGNSRDEDWTVTNFPIYHVGLNEQGYVFAYPKYSIAPGSDGCPVYVISNLDN